MPDIVSVSEFIKSELGEFNYEQSHVDLLLAWIAKSKFTLTDLCDLIESGSEEERDRLVNLLRPFSERLFCMRCNRYIGHREEHIHGQSLSLRPAGHSSIPLTGRTEDHESER